MSGFYAAFCPACGSPTKQKEHTGRIRPVCLSCGHVVYFDPKVAAIAFIAQDEKLLLVKRGMDPGKGLWAMAGGFVDYDEHPENAAIREVKEETALDVEILGVLDVFHNIDDGGVITIAYAAKIIGGVMQPGDDAAKLEWFSRKDDLPELVFISTKSLVARWKNGEL